MLERIRRLCWRRTKSDFLKDSKEGLVRVRDVAGERGIFSSQRARRTWLKEGNTILPLLKMKESPPFRLRGMLVLIYDTTFNYRAATIY